MGIQYTGVRLDRRVLAAGLVPFLALSLYLVATRWGSDRFTTSSDYVAVGVAVLAGAMFVARLPIKRGWRDLTLLVYIPVVGLLLCGYALWFVTAVFDEAL